MSRLLLALIAVVALGLFSRLRPIGWSLYDKSLGDILYAVAAYLALALLLYRWATVGHAAGFWERPSRGMMSVATLLVWRW
jgi:hypothetical protein